MRTLKRDTRKMANDVSASTRAQLRSAMRTAQAKLKKSQRDMERYIANNPKKATAIAAGVGVAIGAILTAAIMRRRRKAREQQSA